MDFHELDTKDKKGLIRKFSDKWNQDEPSNSLALGVAVAASGSQDLEDLQEVFKSLYEDPDGEGLEEDAKFHLEKSSEVLRQSWEEYLKEVDTKAKGKSDLVFEPTGDDIFAEFAANIESSVADWKRRKGKAHEYAFSCCQTLSNHSNFFSIFPTENMYCSLLCGVLKTLIKAGANHKEIGQKLDETMQSINEQVRLCQLDYNLMQTKDIRALIMRLYAQVFKLFGLILHYYSKTMTRFRAAFNQNAFEERFGSHIKGITNLTDLIRKRAELGTRAEQRVMHLSMMYRFKQLNANQHIILTKLDELKEAQENETKRMKAQQGAGLNWLGAALLELGTSGQRFLSQSDHPPEAFRYGSSYNAEQTRSPFFLSIQSNSSGPLPSSATANEIEEIKIRPLGKQPSVDEDLSKEMLVHKASDIEKNSQKIKDLLCRNPLPLASSEGPMNSGILPQPDVMAALQSWTVSKEAQILWIHGLNGQKQRQSFTNLVKTVVANAAKFDVNTFYFSCDPYSDEYSKSGGDGEAQKSCLLDMIYVFIWQLVQILPKYPKTSQDFSAARFEACNEEYSSLPAAVGILNDLLDLAPPLTIVVIDGLERLDHSVVEKDLKHILSLLLSHAKKQAPVEVLMEGASNAQDAIPEHTRTPLKILLTTVESCQPLVELYQEYGVEMTQVLVAWQKWHQYGKDVNLFSE